MRAGGGDRAGVQERVARAQALDYVLGYTCANDVSARDWQIRNGSGQWCRGKTFDTFAPLGPCLVTRDEIPNPNALKIATILNGERVQDWTTSDMIFDVPRLIEFLSGSTTLVPGTVILTGTPHGVGMARKPPRWLKPGDIGDRRDRGDRPAHEPGRRRDVAAGARERRARSATSSIVAPNASSTSPQSRLTLMPSECAA